MPPDFQLIHATCLEVGGIGILLLGSPGSGKSDLALRLIDQGGGGTAGTWKEARLVSDDQVLVHLVGGRLVASPPPVIAGRLEIRGLGLVNLPHLEEVVLGCAFRLAAAAAVDRLPEAGQAGLEVLGQTLPLLLIDPSAASAPARIRAAVDWLGRS